MNDSPKRRWFQFSLRTLILLLVVCSMVLAVYAWIEARTYQAQKNRQRMAAVQIAASKIHVLGGRIGSSYELRRPATWLEELFDDPGGPDNPIEDVRVSYVSLANTSVTDAGLEHLKGLTKLKELDLESTNVTDAGVKKLQQALPNCKIHR